MARNLSVRLHAIAGLRLDSGHVGKEFFPTFGQTRISQQHLMSLLVLLERDSFFEKRIYHCNILTRLALQPLCQLLFPVQLFSKLLILLHPQQASLHFLLQLDPQLGDLSL